jgi:hypothetical protein
LGTPASSRLSQDTVETLATETAGHLLVAVRKHQKEKTMAKATTVKILTIAEIDKLPLKERYTLYKDNVVTPFKAIKNAQKKATDSLHVAAKVHASLKREHVAMLAVGTLAAGTSEKEFFEKHCGGTPSGRVLAVSTFFNAICMTLVETMVDGKPVKKSLIDEVTMFDPHSGNALEIGAACIAAERKLLPDGWMGTDNTLDVISALSTPGDATTKLKKIRKRQKGEKEETGEGNVPHTIASCIAFLKDAIAKAGEILKSENGSVVVSELYLETYYNMGAA